MTAGQRIAGIVLALIMGGGLTGLAEDKPTEAAQKVDIVWLGLVDAAQYGQSWRVASARFQALVPEDKWEQALQATRAPLGTQLSRTLATVTFTKTLPGAPDGSYVVAQYQTSFEHKGAATETIVASLEKDGSWKVAGYFIK